MQSYMLLYLEGFWFSHYCIQLHCFITNDFPELHWEPGLHCSFWMLSIALRVLTKKNYLKSIHLLGTFSKYNMPKRYFQFRLSLQISISHQVAQKHSPVRCNFTIQLDCEMNYRFMRHLLPKVFLLSNFRFSLQLSEYRQV